jgi:LPXTG-motif cell wall-anchored protein
MHMKKVKKFAALLLIAGLLSAQAFALDVTPSVESKDAPEVTATVEVNGVATSVAVVVTPVSKAEHDDTPEEISEALVAAKEDLTSVTTLGDLKTDDGGTIQADLEKALEGTENKVEDLVVTNVFDVSLVDEDGNPIDTNGPVTLTFAVAGDNLVVLHSPTAGVWEVIDSSKVKVNDDGTVNVTFDSLSPIVFLSVAATDVVPDDGSGVVTPGDDNKTPATDDKTTTNKPATDNKTTTGSKTVTSPQTGETTNTFAMTAAVMLLAAASFCAVRAKRVAR